MSTIETVIGEPSNGVFRRAYIRRRLLATGKYESDWLEITAYVKSWGEFTCEVDATRVNQFTFSGVTITVRNDEGKFNPETSTNSLWYGYLTRYRSLLKIEAGYVDEAGNELPLASTQGVFIIDGEIIIDSATNEATLQTVSIANVFAEVKAADIPALGPTQTASDFVTIIKNHTDGSGNFVFREYITATSWTIETTTALYNVATTSAFGDMSCWEFMTLLAEAEGYTIYPDRFGGMHFENRDPNTTAAQFTLNGLGQPRPNVIALESYKEAIDKFYSQISLRYLTAETTSSYIFVGTATAVSAANLAWKYGAKTLEVVNQYINNTATAQSLATALYNQHSVMKMEMQVKCKMLPHVDLFDRLAVNWTSIGIDSRLWDTEDWASDTASAPMDGLSWDPESGENFDLSAFNVKVLSRKTNLDDFTTTLVVREI